jgi:hypothetical protein
MGGVPVTLLHALAVISAAVGLVTVGIIITVRFLWRRGKPLQEP